MSELSHIHWNPPVYHLADILAKLTIPFTVEGRGGLSFDLSFDLFAPISGDWPNSMTFVSSKSSKADEWMKHTQSKIIVCDRNMDIERYRTPYRTFIVTDNPKLLFMRIVKIAHLHRSQERTDRMGYLRTESPGIHPTALLHVDVVIGKNVTIGPYSIIGPCIIGDGCTIGSHVTIDGSVTMGKNVAIGAYCNIGGEGFGHIRNEHGNYENMPHIGTVNIGDNVEILPYTNVDRGTLSATIIGEGSKVDHYCHISHNSIIGKDTLVAAKAVLCGGSKVGDSCFIGVGATIREKKVVGYNATIGMGAVVVKDVPEGETWHGNPAKAHHY